MLVEEVMPAVNVSPSLQSSCLSNGVDVPSAEPSLVKSELLHVLPVAVALSLPEQSEDQHGETDLT